MATEAEAAREARAKVIAAEGEMRASQALKEASDVISMSPAALQVFNIRVEGLATKASIIESDNSIVTVSEAPEPIVHLLNRGQKLTPFYCYIILFMKY